MPAKTLPCHHRAWPLNIYRPYARRPARNKANLPVALAYVCRRQRRLVLLRELHALLVACSGSYQDCCWLQATHTVCVATTEQSKSHETQTRTEQIFQQIAQRQASREQGMGPTAHRVMQSSPSCVWTWSVFEWDVWRWGTGRSLTAVSHHGMYCCAQAIPGDT